jgi:hypothetical protein
LRVIRCYLRELLARVNNLVKYCVKIITFLDGLALEWYFKCIFGTQMKNLEAHAIGCRKHKIIRFIV